MAGADRSADFDARDVFPQVRVQPAEGIQNLLGEVLLDCAVFGSPVARREVLELLEPLVVTAEAHRAGGLVAAVGHVVPVRVLDARKRHGQLCK